MVTKDTHSDANIKHLSLISDGAESFDLECYESVDAIYKLREDWLLLAETCTEDFTYFQTYNWCIEYYKQFADDLSNKHCPIPQVFVLRKNGAPIMIWPLMRIQSRTGLKILTTATEPLGQYSSLLFDPAKFTEHTGQETLKHIIEHSKSDSVSFNHYPSGSMIDKIIADQGIKENSNLKSSILDFSQYDNWQDYYQTLSKGQRKSRRRSKNKLAAEGDISYRTYFAGTEEYKELVAKALEMKTQWLLETGRKPGLLADECTKAMFMDLEKPSQKEETGPITQALLLNNQPVAIELGMIKSDRYYSYLGAIDWAFKDFGPGNIQMEMAQEWCMNKGIKCFDLLHDPSEYKSSWSNHTHNIISRNIAITTRGYIYSKLWKTYIRPKLKSIYHFTGAKNRERLNKLRDLVRK